MKRLPGTFLLAGLCAGLAGLSLLGPARACAPVMGRGHHVAIASESALIIWDEKTKTEHFIRRGTFHTRLPYFGFLVPSPSQPALAEAPDDLFTQFEDWTKPEVIVQTIRRPRNSAMKFSRSLAPGEAAPLPTAPNVQVLDMQQVAGYDAVVLKANDAKKLKEWLEEHGYVTRPDLEKWLEPYIKAGWIITAFQIGKEGDQPGTGKSTQSVRMTFQTDRPFYPYAEPADQRAPGAFRPGRMLRVFFLGNARVEGKLDDPKTPWPGKAAWSNTLAADRRKQVIDKLKIDDESLPQKTRLTVFDDQSSPRPGVADLFFSVSSDQSTLARPPIIQTNYIDVDPPLGDGWLIVVVAGLGVLLTGALGVLVWGLVSRWRTGV
jgi:hypothetical protein